MTDKTIDDILVGIRIVPKENSEATAVDSIRQFKRSALKILAPLAGAFTVGKLFSFTSDIIKAKDHATILGKQLRISSNELYKLDVASSRFGTSFSENLLNIQELFSGINLEDKSSLFESLGKFGVNPTPLSENKDRPMKIYNALLKQWGNLNIGQRLGVKQTLGLSQGMFDILQNQGRFNQYKSDVITPSTADMQEARKAKEAMDKIGLTLQSFMGQIATGLTPAIASLSTEISKINTEKLSNLISTMIGIVSKYMVVDGGKFSVKEYSKEIHKMTKSELEKERKSIRFSVANPFSGNHDDTMSKEKAIDDELLKREQQRLHQREKESSNHVSPSAKYNNPYNTDLENQSQTDVSSNRSKTVQIGSMTINNQIHADTDESILDQFEHYVSQALQDTMEGN